MPRHLKRYYGSGDLHFITSSCYHRKPRLGSAARRDLFLAVLEQVRKRYAFVVAGYVVMPEHFHLLVSEPQRGTPSTVMQALKLGFARRVLAELRRRRAPGLSVESSRTSVWQARFYDFNVWTERKRIEKLRRVAHISAASIALALRTGGAPHLAGFEMREGAPGNSPVHPSQTNRSPLFYSAVMPRDLKRYYGSGDLHFIT
jgi:putative transposase